MKEKKNYNRNRHSIGNVILGININVIYMILFYKFINLCYYKNVVIEINNY